MDFQVGEEAPIASLEEHQTALTQMESSAQEIHKALNNILDYQTHHRLREAQGISFHHKIFVWKKGLIFRWKDENVPKTLTNGFCGGQSLKHLAFYRLASVKYWFCEISLLSGQQTTEDCKNQRLSEANERKQKLNPKYF